MKRDALHIDMGRTVFERLQYCIIDHGMVRYIREIKQDRSMLSEYLEGMDDKIVAAPKKLLDA